MIKSFSKSDFTKIGAELIAFLIVRKYILDVTFPRKRTIFIQNIMNWFNHDTKIIKKPTDKIDNSHESLDFFLGGGGSKV
jgi:hypothetical protein